LERLQNGNKVFEVDERTFSELDEIIETYIYPMFRSVQDLVKNPKFVNCDMEEMGMLIHHS
jgi:hypothetical protein